MTKSHHTNMAGTSSRVLSKQPSAEKKSNQKTFTAVFTYKDRKFIELNGSFCQEAKILRGILHTIHTYLKKRDEKSIVQFKLADPSHADYFSLLCLSPALKPFFNFVEPAFLSDTKSSLKSTDPVDGDLFKMEIDHIESNPKSCEMESEHIEINSRWETHTEETPSCNYDSKGLEVFSCYEPDVQLHENPLSVNEDIVFSSATFEPEQSVNSPVDDSEEMKVTPQSLEEEAEKVDDVDKFFQSVSEKKQRKADLRRARAREREKRVPRLPVPPPSIELLSKRMALVQGLFPSRIWEGSEKDRLLSVFRRNRAGKILVELTAMVEDPQCTFKCSKCDCAVEGQSEYIKHYRMCDPTGSLIFSCLFCEQIRNEEEMLGHLRSHFYDNVCHICDIIGPMKSHTAMQHKTTHLPPERFPNTYEEHQNARFTCLVCESQVKAFKKDKDHYRRHLVEAHANPGQCEMCGLQLISHAKLRFHRMSAHHVPHNCAKCGEFLPSFALARRHSCGSEKMQICEFCGKSINRHHINRHVKEVHDVGEKKMHKCDYCDATFIRKFPLKQHMNIHKGEKPYICLVCNKSHSSIAALGVHTRSRHDMTATEMREHYKNGTLPQTEE